MCGIVFITPPSKSLITLWTVNFLIWPVSKNYYPSGILWLDKFKNHLLLVKGKLKKKEN